MTFSGTFINRFLQAAWFRDVETRITDLEGAPPGSASWGTISGTLSSQTDLQTALDAKTAGAASSVDSEMALYSGTGGKTLKRASTTGILKGTSGVLSAATSGTDYAPATSGSAILKGNGAGGFSSAVASTDYAPATSGSAILKGNGTGGFSSAVASTDYAPATSGSSILKGNGTGGFSNAASGTDYAPATSGSSILKGNGSGGFSNAVSATDYAPATTGTAILKASSGGFANAVSGTDYAPATTGSSILKASSGGFANAVSGTDYAPATSGSGLLKGNGSGGFSTATDGTDYYSSSYAVPNANIPNGINNGSRASQSQVVVSGTAYYITRSNLALPASSKTGGGMVVGTTFRWRLGMTKTAAGTGTFQIRIYRGTNGSTSDTADVTQTLGTQTAAVDNMTIDVMVTVTTTGATGAYYWTMLPQNKAVTATGFGIATGTGAFFSGTVSAVALNTASLQFGLAFIATTGTPTIAIPFCHGQVFNMT